MANKKAPKMYGRAIIKPGTFDREKRTVEVVFATETPVTRYGWSEDYEEVLVCEASAIRMERVNRGLPVLDSHSIYTLENQVGRSSDVWVSDNREACARLHFSKRPKVEDLLQDIEDGLVTDISVGYRVYKYEREPQGDNKRPIYRAIDWEPREISWVSVPADINSGVRSGEEENDIEIITSKNQRSMKPVEEDAGKPATTQTPAPAPAATEGARAADPVPAPAPVQEPEPSIEAIRAAASKEASQRIEGIVSSVRAAGLPESMAITLIQGDKDLAACRADIIAEAAKRNTTISGVHGISVGDEGIEKKRSAMEGAILHRIAPKQFKLEDGAREFRGYTMTELARIIFAERGISTSGKGKLEIANMVFSRSHSSTDFPVLFEGVLDKMLRATYPFAPEYWDKVARQTNVADFREKGIYTAGHSNGMKEIKEGGELKYTTLMEGKERIRAKTYGEGISFTRQAFVNDDLGVFSMIPSMFVRDWATMRGNLVWGLIVDNVTMGDDVALFATGHNNLLTGATSALSETSLATAKVKMSQQKGIGKEVLRIEPHFLIVPPELEVTARKLIADITPSKTDDVNVFARKFIVIVEPRLTDPTAWYLSADPNAYDTLYYAYLDGNESLRVDMEDSFKTDSMEYGVRGDFGVAAVDYRGLVKSAGK
jgi:hypothetical protein